MHTKHFALLPPPLRIFVSLLTSAGLLCLVTEAIAAIRHLGYPYDYPLLFRHPSFMDFRSYFEHFSTFHTLAFFEGPDIIMYPSPTVLCYRFFYSFQPIATPVFLTFILAVAVTAAVLSAKTMIHYSLEVGPAVSLLILTSIFSFPLWFEFKQANMEVVVWLLIILALLAFWKNFFWQAAVLFGIAASIKFYPVAYLGLLFSRKRYRECLLGCFVACAVILFSLWVVGPSVPDAWRGMQKGLSIFRSYYMIYLRPNEIGFDHSLFGIIKVLCALAVKSKNIQRPSPQQFSTLLSLYLALAAITLSALYFLRIRFLPIANQLLCITLVSVTMPPVSFDYTLLHLYAPWLVVALTAIQAARRGVPVPGMNAVMVCFALAFAPLSEFIFHHERFGGQLRGIVLLALFALALKFPISSGPGTSEERFQSCIPLHKPPCDGPPSTCMASQSLIC